MFDLAGQGVDLVQQDPGQFAVVVVEPAGEGLNQRGVFDPQPAPGQVRRDEGVRLPGELS
ncbi:hypothetical protein [Arthrobacter sp. UYCo732]